MADMFDKEELGIVSGLFGNPLQRARAEQLGAYELYSKAAGAQNPFAGLAGLSGMFATGAGQDIRGALGVQNAQERMDALRQQAQQQFDTNTPQGLLQMAEFLNRQGDAAGARQAVMLAQGQAQKAATFGKTMEETRILGREVKEIGVPGNTELVQKAVVDKDGRVIKLVGEPYSRFSQKTSIKVDAGEKNLLDIDKKDAELLVKTRDSAENVIPRLEEQLKAVNRGIISGTFNDARKVFANSLATFGIKDKATLDLLANTDKFNANRIELASAVAKQLGVNPTDRDFQASLDRFASGSMQPEVAVTFINDMLAIQRKKLTDAKAGLDYYRQNKGSFAGYDRPLPVSPVASDPLQNMSLEQLKALEQQLLNKGKR